MTRLVRFRVRDLASCLLTCRFPLGNETDRCAQVQVRNLVYDDRSDDRTNHNSSKKMSRTCKKCRKRRQLHNGLEKEKDGVSVEKRDDESCKQFVDEDFIVFCFGENESFDLVKDDSDLQPEDLCDYNGSPRISKPENCKKKRCSKQNIYCDHEGGMKRVTTEERRHEGRLNAKINNGGYEDSISEAKEGDMLEIVCRDTERQEEKQQQQHQQLTEGIGESQHLQKEESEQSRVASLESRDSNQSDCSTGSFTFPVLGWELIGSPAHMPQSEEGHQPHHHKVHPARFQCGKF